MVGFFVPKRIKRLSNCIFDRRRTVPAPNRICQSRGHVGDPLNRRVVYPSSSAHDDGAMTTPLISATRKIGSRRRACR